MKKFDYSKLHLGAKDRCLCQRDVRIPERSYLGYFCCKLCNKLIQTTRK